MSKDNKIAISVNQKDKIEIDRSKIKELDLIPKGKNKYHAIYQNQSLEIELVSFDEQAKTMDLKINSTNYNFKIWDHVDVLVDKLGLNLDQEHKLLDVKAPMPGKVIEVLIEEGQNVEPGESLLILEAMKMENVIKANGEGLVSKVLVQKGEAVEKGQLMIECN